MMHIVILRHDGIDSPHYDLMIEPQEGSPLWTWRLPNWPSPPSGQTVRRLPDHRNEYLQYEGPIIDNRGRVTRIFASQCDVIATEHSITLTAAVPSDSAAAPFGTLRLSRQRNDAWTLTVLPCD
jgi:hypothetical protein